MKIIFFGSSQFAVPSLKAILTSGHQISCVVTQPDRPKGRGLRFLDTAAKVAAGEANLKIYQPEHLNTDEAIKFLKKLNPDLFIVVSYGQILSREVLEIPKIFSLNAHASLLPKYRGAAPINWAIINGEATTGITIIKMTEKMDAGPVILQKTIQINADDTAITLADKLSRMAAGLLIEAIGAIGKNNYNLIAQDEGTVSFAPKLKKEDGWIDWNRPAREIYNLIRGALGWPGAFTYYKGKLLKIYQAKVCPSCRLAVLPSSRLAVLSSPGEVIQVSPEAIVVATAEDNLMIEELQIESKRRMASREFIAGYKINIGERLGKK